MREQQREMLLSLPIMLVAVGVPFGIAFLLFALFAPSGTGPFAAAIALGGMALFLASLFLTAQWGEGWTARRRAHRVREELEARGEATLGDEIVGIQYSNELWRDPIFGDSWDWGALRLDVDRLSFKGRDSRFELFSKQIESLEIRRFDHALIGPIPRLYVTWSKGDRTDVFSLDLPHNPSQRRRVEAIEALRERIERWRSGPSPSLGAHPTVSPPQGDDLRPLASPVSQIGTAAKLLAIGAVLPAIVVVEVLLVLLFGYFDLNFGPFAGFPSILGFIAWFSVAVAIEKRLPKRWQHPSRRNMPEVDLPEVTAIESDTVRLRN